LPITYAEVAATRSSQRIKDKENNKHPVVMKISEPNPKENGEDRTAIRVETTLKTIGPKPMENEDYIKVIFEVLLANEMSFPESFLGICFGPPLSDWTPVDVTLSPKNGNSGETYTLMTGVYDFPRFLLGKTIPYKYVVFNSWAQCKWEHIHDIPDHGQMKNRCLIVPDVESQFTKFDDVVLSKDQRDVFDRVTRGRLQAALRMLPRPEDFMDSDFSLSAVLKRFEQVLEAQVESRVCVDNERSYKFMPPGYYAVKVQTEKCYMEHCLNCLVHLVAENGDNVRLILRMITYICLIKSRLGDYQFTVDNYQLMFKAFRGCAGQLCDEASLSWVSGEMQAKACDALKLLVRNFLDLKRPRYEDNSQGNWISVIPFIHRWDLPDRNDTDWLKLDTWKTNLRCRYRALVFVLFSALG